MPFKTGLSAQLGFGPESPYGTPAVPVAYLPHSGNSMSLDRKRIESDAIFAGRAVQVSGMHVNDVDGISGDVNLDLYNRGTGYLWQAMLGSVVTTGAGPYSHVFSPPAAGELPSLTFQEGIPSVAGVVYAFTWSGCKVSKWELSCSTGAIPKLKVSTVAQREFVTRVVADAATTSASPNLTSVTAAFASDDVGKPISGTGIPVATTILSVTSATTVVLSANATATGTGVAVTIGVPLGTPTYPATIKPFSWAECSLTLGGSTVKATQFTLSGDNGQDDGRAKLGQTYVDEPLTKQRKVFSGSLDLDFTDLTQYRRFLQAAEVALVISFVSGSDTLTLNANVRIDGGPIMVGGPDVVPDSVTFECVAPLAGTDASAITATLVNADALP